jgi:8-oxo-dGTP diphosphatase
MGEDKITAVVCLILRDSKGLVLTTLRPGGKRLGLLWEFPGGKVEAGESPQDALRREIFEELGIELGLLRAMTEVRFSYTFGQIRLIPFESFCETRPVLTLAEHVDAKWFDIQDWHTLDWAPADVPVIKQLLNETPSR